VVAAEIGHWFVEGRVLFQGLSFRLVPGQVYAVTGPSGSGKSTLLSLLAGWERPRLGAVKWFGVSQIRWVFQNPVGVAQRSTLDHVAFPFVAAGLGRLEAEQRAGELLEVFGLAQVADSPFGALSGGEAQRLMLARGVAGDPDLLLVDEPTAQLDRAAAAGVNQAVAALARRGVIVVVATHDQRTRQACDEVIDLEVL
jgi:ABC-type lipoprotein export system ATPase subunit